MTDAQLLDIEEAICNLIDVVHDRDLSGILYQIQAFQENFDEPVGELCAIRSTLPRLAYCARDILWTEALIRAQVLKEIVDDWKTRRQHEALDKHSGRKTKGCR